MPKMRYNAYNWKLNLTADGRRRTPTFCPADLAGQNLQALRAGEFSGQGDVLDKLRLVPHREARASFSSGSPEAKNQSLRWSACVCGKKNMLTYFGRQ